MHQVEATAAGWQVVMPSYTPPSRQERIQHLASLPYSSRKGRAEKARPADLGLFDEDARNRAKNFSTSSDEMAIGAPSGRKHHATRLAKQDLSQPAHHPMGGVKRRLSETPGANTETGDRGQILPLAANRAGATNMTKAGRSMAQCSYA